MYVVRVVLQVDNLGRYLIVICIRYRILQLTDASFESRSKLKPTHVNLHQLHRAPPPSPSPRGTRKFVHVAYEKFF